MGHRKDVPNLVAFNDRRDQVAALAAGLFDDQWLTVQQAAEELGIGEHTIRRAYQGGHLKIRRFGVGGCNIRIRRGDLRSWFEAGGNTTPLPGQPRR